MRWTLQMLSSMKPDRIVSPSRVLLPVGVGTCLSLLGDASLYAVLPTQTAEAGVSIASLGILLSANRFVRLISNGPAGVAYDRGPRRWLFVSALFVGAFSTALYGLTLGFWPLVVGRLLWGLSWSGIWVGGNTIVLDIARDDTRGRWVGVYQVFFYLGAAGGAVLGGFLTDKLGYHQGMNICAGLTFLGAVIAFIFLPETRGLMQKAEKPKPAPRPPVPKGKESGSRLKPNPTRRTAFAAAAGLYSVNRLVIAGVFSATFGLFLLSRVGDQVQVGGRLLGVATLTGLGLGLCTLISAISAPLIGGFSDRVRNRWRVAAAGLLPGVVGFCLLANKLPMTVLVGVPLIAVTGGSNQGLSTALIGDLGNFRWQSRQLGVMFTAGDLASAVGPLSAYALIPLIGVSNVYLLVAGLLVFVFLVILRTDRKRSARRNG
jgi:MFS family permease